MVTMVTLAPNVLPEVLGVGLGLVCVGGGG